MRFVFLNGSDLSHPVLAEAFGFPPYYGGNLDALYDCLTQIARHTMIVLADADKAEPRVLSVIRASVAENDSLCLLKM